MAKTKTKGIGGKVVAVVLAAAIIGGATCAAGYGSRGDNGKWFQNPNMATWFDSWGKGDKIAGSEGSAVVTPGEQTGMKMTAVRMMTAEQNVDSVYELSVTYTPEDTTYQETTFTAAFKNPNSTWAKGKDVSQYVKIVHTAGAKTAQAQVLQSFEEQVIITAQNNRHTDIKATATVDYVGYYSVSTTCDDVDNCSNDIEIEGTKLKGGTIAPDINGCITFEFDIGEQVVTKMQNKGYTLTRFVNVNTTPDLNSGSTSPIDNLESIFCKAGSVTTETKSAYWQALSSVLLGGTSPSTLSGEKIMSYRIKSHRVYNGVTYADWIGEFNDLYLIDWSEFEVVPTAINTNTTSIIAG